MTNINYDCDIKTETKVLLSQHELVDFGTLWTVVTVGDGIQISLPVHVSSKYGLLTIH